MRTFTYSDAILSLRPEAIFKIVGNDINTLVWLDETQTAPYEAEITAEVTRLQEEYTSKDYQRSRADEYPSIGDQLDMLYHDQLDGTTTWKDSITAIKDKYPKPE